MAKNSVRDYDATNANNTDIQSIDISEGCSPAGINNAIREIMADLKDVSTGAVALESPSADSLTVTGDLTVDTNTLYVDSTNNLVGIGETSPSSNLHVKGGAGANIAIQSTAGSHWRIGDAVGASNGEFVIRDHTNSANRMIIDGSGNLLLGTASSISSGFYSSSFNGASKNGIVLQTTLASNGTDFIRFINSSGSVIGEIEQNSGSTVAYLTSSDYRLKTAVTYDWDATSRVKQLKPARFAWIADGDDAVPVDGFLAHEVQDIVPEAISGTKDAVDDEGNPVYQGIDQSKLVPLLVKTIQELEARITALEAN